MKKEKSGALVSLDRRISRDGGAIFIWIVLLTPVLIALAALAVDFASHSVRIAQVRNTAEAVAYAAVSELDGTLDGWKRSKRAALQTFQQSKIIGAAASIPSMTYASGSRDDVYETEAAYRFNTAQDGNLLVEVIRGAYLVDVEDSSNVQLLPRFVNLETPPAAAAPKRFHFNVPVYALATTVQVRIRLSGLRPFLAQVMGFSSFQDIERTTMAMADENEGCVAPFAVNLCDLYQDTYGARYSSQYQFAAQKQCSRELMFTESLWSHANLDAGRFRARAVPRPPYQPGNTISLNGGSIRGVLGVPANGTNAPELIGPMPDSTTRANLTKLSKVQPLIQNMFTAPPPANCRNFRLGQRFLPLQSVLTAADYNTPPGSWTVFDDNTLITDISNWIKGPGGDTFRGIFGQVGPGLTPADNYPHLRTIRPGTGSAVFRDLWDADFPPSAANVLLFPLGNLVTASPSAPWSSAWTDAWSDTPQDVWTNPLCHDPSLPRNDPNAPVRTITAMLIAPAGRNGSGLPYDYCMYDNGPWDTGYWGGESAWNKPTLVTDPRIVGTIRVSVFDFNLRDLTDPTGTGDNYPPPGDRDPFVIGYDTEMKRSGTGSLVPDTAPTAKHCGIVKEFSSGQCALNPRTTGAAPCQLGAFARLLYFPETKDADGDNVPDVCTAPANPSSPGFGSLTPPPSVFGSGGSAQCRWNTSPPAPSPLPNEYPHPWPGTTCGGVAQGSCTGAVPPFPWDRVTVKCFPLGPAGSWDIRHRPAQKGCGGIRARLSCENNKALNMLAPTRDQRRPQLVSVE